MPEYTVVPDGIHGYGVEVSSIGSFRLVRGFPTETAAVAWIAEQQAIDERLRSRPIGSTVSAEQSALGRSKTADVDQEHAGLGAWLSGTDRLV
jgi:hypothetical protein